MTTHRLMLYSGRVQGVGFRYTVKQIATGFEVVGWVRNLPDGRVELQVGGEMDEVNAFFQAIAESHLGGYVMAADEGEAAPPAVPPTRFEIHP